MPETTYKELKDMLSDTASEFSSSPQSESMQ